MPDADEKRSRFKIALDFLKRLLGKKPSPPGDPYAYAMAPLHRGPKGRSGEPPRTLSPPIPQTNCIFSALSNSRVKDWDWPPRILTSVR